MTNQTIEKYNIGTTHTIQRRDFKNNTKKYKIDRGLLSKQKLK